MMQEIVSQEIHEPSIRRGHGVYLTLPILAAILFASVAEARDYEIAIDARESAPAGTPVTFGLVLEPGDVQFDRKMIGNIEIGGVTKPVEVQVDRKTSYCEERFGDGSLALEFQPKDKCASSSRFLRHAVFTAVLPTALSSSQRAKLTLSSTSEDHNVGGGIVFPKTLDVSTRLVINDESWIADIKSVASELSSLSLDYAGESASAVTQWLDGELVREWVIRVPFARESFEDQLHEHLVARYSVRHYPDQDQTRVDVVVENTHSMKPGMQSYDYSAQVFIDGSLRYEDDSLKHFPHARWRVTMWRKAYPELKIIHDPRQLIASRSIPNYDEKLLYSLHAKLKTKSDDFWSDNGPVIAADNLLRFPAKQTVCYEDASLERKTDCSDADSYSLSVNTVGPMGVGGLPLWYMPSTGGRSEIAPLPRWIATWVLDQSYSSYKTMLALADASGSWPVHMRDSNTDAAISIEDYPSLVLPKGPSDDPNEIQSCEKGPKCQKPYTADRSHQPSYAYVPYLVTGDYFYLEEMQFWATYNSLLMNAKQRGFEKGIIEVASQLRGAAWGLRNLAQAASATPDGHTLKRHHLNVLRNNIEEYNEIYVSNPELSNTYGAVVTSQWPITSPWMDDYFTWAVGHTLELGYESIKPLAEWKSRFPVQRLSAGDADETDYCWVFAAQYHLLMGPTDQVPASKEAGLDTVDIKRGLNTIPKTRTVFRNIDSVFQLTNLHTNGNFEIPRGGGIETAESCGSSLQFNEQQLEFGEINGNSGFEGSNLSQMGPAISVAVDMGVSGSADAWLRYSSRANPPNYDESPSWAIVPRASVSESTGQLETEFPVQEPVAVAGECIAHDF